MQNYVCSVCGYVYDPAKGDPDNGIAPGTPFEALPDDWACPLCSVGKDMFQAQQFKKQIISAFLLANGHFYGIIQNVNKILVGVLTQISYKLIIG